MRRLKIIASAYACEPGRGSEPGIGWNVVRELALRHEVWVITRRNNRADIEAALRAEPGLSLHLVPFDLPAWSRWWKRGRRGLMLYYYLWQIGAYLLARSLHRKHLFDLAHHVTFGRYWNPSFLPLLRLPFVWGPVGGGESAPASFRRSFSARGRLYEFARDLARRAGEHDPFVRLTARRCTVALATTVETEKRLHALGVERVVRLGNAALSEADLDALHATPPPPASPVRFLSIGRLLHWKGFDLGLRAFAAASLPPDAEYWIVGDGPEADALHALSLQLGIAHRARFLGGLSREQTLATLADCHVLVHPSLHDSGGWVCVEALAAGRPVLCLDLGGPALVVDPAVGVRIPASSPEAATGALAEAMSAMARDAPRRAALGRDAGAAARDRLTWSARGETISREYERIARAIV